MQIWTDLPERERPQWRIAEQGTDYCSDSELLASILNTRRVDTARGLLAHYDGSLQRLALASVYELEQLPGIGRVSAARLHAALALGARTVQQESGTVPVLDCPAHVARYLSPHFAGKQQEEFHALLLDTKNRLIKDCLVTLGLVDRSLAHPREVFRFAIAESATRVLLAHNHPSGDPTPSSGDIQCTTQLAKAGEIIGIQVIDHVIIGGVARDDCPPFISFQEKHLL